MKRKCSKGKMLMKMRKSIKKKMGTFIMAMVITASAFTGCGETSKGETTSIEKLEKLEGNYKKSSFEQIDVNSDTVKWMCSAYAIYTKYNDKDLWVIGGLEEDHREHYRDSVKNELSEGWGISDRDDVVKVINKLITKGHREEYRKVVKDLKKKDLLKLSTEEAMAKLPDDDELPRYQDAHEVYKAYGEKGLDGWDYCRALQVLGDCYQAEYINLEECLDLSLPIAEELQSSFKSWEEVADSYIHGYAFWKKMTVDDIEMESRVEAYQELAALPGGPYSIPYDTKLENTWKDGEKQKEERKNAETADGYTPIRCGEADLLQVKLPEDYIFDTDFYEEYGNTALYKISEEGKSEYKVSYEARYVGGAFSPQREEEMALKNIESQKERATETGDTYEGSEIRTVQVGDLSVSYVAEKNIKKEDGYQSIRYRAWTTVADRYLLICEIFEGKRQEEQLALVMDGEILKTLFSDIKW